MYQAKYFPNLFCRYVRKGRDWIKALSPEDMQAFIRLGLMYAEYGKLGGMARARSAKRDYRGRFTKG